MSCTYNAKGIVFCVNKMGLDDVKLFLPWGMSEKDPLDNTQKTEDQNFMSSSLPRRH